MGKLPLNMLLQPHERDRKVGQDFVPSAAATRPALVNSSEVAKTYFRPEPEFLTEPDERVEQNRSVKWRLR